MIPHVHIMTILRVRQSLPPIITVLHVMVRSRLGQEKNYILRPGCELHTSPRDLTFFIVVLLD
jgi:hypothetical protein